MPGPDPCGIDIEEYEGGRFSIICEIWAHGNRATRITRIEARIGQLTDQGAYHGKHGINDKTVAEFRILARALNGKCTDLQHPTHAEEVGYHGNHGGDRRRNSDQVKHAELEHQTCTHVDGLTGGKAVGDRGHP